MELCGRRPNSNPPLRGGEGRPNSKVVPRDNMRIEQGNEMGNLGRKGLKPRRRAVSDQSPEVAPPEGERDLNDRFWLSPSRPLRPWREAF